MNGEITDFWTSLDGYTMFVEVNFVDHSEIYVREFDHELVGYERRDTKIKEN